MMNTNTQQEMQQLISRCMDSHSYDTASECLKVYQSTFGYDNFYTDCNLTLICENGPLVSLICIQGNAADAEAFRNAQDYKNIEIFYTEPEHMETGIKQYLESAGSKYVCFFEPGQAYNPQKLSMMVSMAEQQPSLDGLMCSRNFIDAGGTIIAHPDYIYQDALNDKLFIGRDFIEYCIVNHVNLYGSLSTLLLTVPYMKKVCGPFPGIPHSMKVLSYFYQLIKDARITYNNLPLVSTVLKPYEDSSSLEADYEVLVQALYENGYLKQKRNAPKKQGMAPYKRDITFIYTDKGEYYNLKPIADEAEKRGYKVTFTTDIKQKAEIGVYCQHVCFPENSRFSVILLHDLAQGHNRWPNLWEMERWNKFDIGILPGEAWAERWSQCACQYYVNPRCGAFNFGYPKSDLIESGQLKNRADELRRKFGFKYKVSVLYAPSWENDGKEDEFVKALSGFEVNLLVKQAHYPPENLQFAPIGENIRQMRAMHEGKYPNLYYIEPAESIQAALALCDFVVSDESSVMAEAVMFGKLSIAVTDWLIPDTVPSRFASVPMDYVLKCKKSQLQEYAGNVLRYPERYQYILEKGKMAFQSPKNVSKNIVDAIEFYTSTQEEQEASSFRHKKLTSKYASCSMWN